MTTESEPMTKPLKYNDPDFWTEQLCPKSYHGEERHHWVPKRDGLVGGEPSFRQVCRYCGAGTASDGSVVPVR
jgi:hypothetical protein